MCEAVSPLAAIAAALAALALALAVVVTEPQPATSQAAPAPQAVQLPNDWRAAWALDFLGALGNTQPSAEIVAFVVEWTHAEDGSDGAYARHNPLNTTMPSGAETHTINGDGVRGYATYQDGIAATVATVTNGLYPELLAGLQTNDYQRAFNGLISSPWAGSRYNGGADWPKLAPQPAAGAQDRQSYVLAGDIGVNVVAALNANGGALQAFTIPPGASWSFGRSIAPISALGHLPVVCGPAGCNPGGGWCDLAAMYVRVCRQLVGCEPQYPAHSGVNDPNMPGIMLAEDGSGADLIITNTGSAPLTFGAWQEGGDLVVGGR